VLDPNRLIFIVAIVVGVAILILFSAVSITIRPFTAFFFYWDVSDDGVVD